ncbi:MAG: 3D domain-containing protein [Romboutsia sp.]
MKNKILIGAITLAMLFIPGTKVFANNIDNVENLSINIDVIKNGYINTDNVNFRSGSNTESSINYTLNKLEKLDIIKSEGEWTKVNHNNKIGYVYSKYISYNNEKEVSLENSKKINVKATAYSGDTITSTGTTPKWGTVAVDPTVIPYGTKVYIEEFDKVFVAEDCGSAIKGNKIDIFMDTEENCNKWGVRNLDIHILA